MVRHSRAQVWRLLESQHAAFLGTALLVTVAVHAGALQSFFAQDDVAFLSRAAGLAPVPGPFRVLWETLAFRLEHALFGLDPLGYHAVSLLLHLLNVTGVYLLATRLDGSPFTGMAAAVLFGVSGIAFTPLHWAAGVSDLLACTLVLGATLLQLASEGRPRAWRWAAAL